jgi:hypothetical protein
LAGQAGNEPGDAMTYLFGQVGADVAGVVLHPEPDTTAATAIATALGDVTATVENGWFLAWRPIESGDLGAVYRTRGYSVTMLDGAILPEQQFDWSAS